ncbi:hypothetical protein [Streptomyces scabiei]|uniref:Secreted protein n=1 Tax=Streptomyces scabiei TaxID=1930 RepID=A0A117EEP0_STRSC|nr:hypothetical protein [Streptomyces scabiei]GAQ64355.1 hypothetical protein SsS58_04748 [Streptomyces scabiei]
MRRGLTRLAALLALAVATPAAGAADGSSSPVATTTAGKVRGGR